MTQTDEAPSKSTFSHSSYATFRPSYPTSLYQKLLAYHSAPRSLCLDLGSGHGVVARALAPSFTTVIGTDPSAGMVTQANSSDNPSNLSFRGAPAESLPFIADGSVDMVVAGQAAHWFDHQRLWPEMARVVRESGTLAFWGYKDHVFVDYPRTTDILNHYAYGSGKELLGDYWGQPGRAIVQNKYRDIVPPAENWESVQRLEYEPGTYGPSSGEGDLFLSKKMTLRDCKSYIRTWSAFHAWVEAHPGVKKAEDGGRGDVVDEMFDKMVDAEDDWQQADRWPELEVRVEWGSGLLLARRRRS
ncbi:MAG: hypothetical protein M1833_004103 [Piccolia ochrophora]|nr:MAG: hypothetical protein M1833_004103 [Piccolia ochrophora]